MHLKRGKNKNSEKASKPLHKHQNRPVGFPNNPIFNEQIIPLVCKSTWDCKWIHICIFTKLYWHENICVWVYLLCVCVPISVLSLFGQAPLRYSSCYCVHKLSYLDYRGALDFLERMWHEITATVRDLNAYKTYKTLGVGYGAGLVTSIELINCGWTMCHNKRNPCWTVTNYNSESQWKNNGRIKWFMSCCGTSCPHLNVSTPGSRGILEKFGCAIPTLFIWEENVFGFLKVRPSNQQ